MDRNNNLKYGIIRFLTICCDLMGLELLWVICSLPIITIGPSTCALYKITLKIANNEPCTVLRGFFEAFKENFKQALVIGAFTIFEIIAIYADINYILSTEGFTQKLFIVVTMIAAAILFVVTSYGYGLIARYNNSLKVHIINAFKLAFVNPIQTLLIWLIILAPVIIFLFVPPIVIIYTGWFFLLFLVSLPTYCISRVLIKVFNKYKIKERA